MRQLQLRVLASSDEAALIAAAARRLGRSISGWSREVLLAAARMALEAPAQEREETTNDGR